MYKTLIAEIGRLLRGVLPYKIVDPNPSNWLASLMTYRDVKSAYTAGQADGKKWMKLAAGTHYISTKWTIAGDNWNIEGAGRSTVIENINASSESCITLSGQHNTLRGFWMKHVTLAAQIIQVLGDRNLIDRVGADAGMPSMSGTYNLATGCSFSSTDGASGAEGNTGGTANMYVGCFFGNTTANECINHNGTGGGFVGCIVRNGGSRSLRSTGNYGLIVGVTHDQGGSMDNGTGNSWTGYTQY
jgi:hypothetical protein